MNKKDIKKIISGLIIVGIGWLWNITSEIKVLMVEMKIVQDDIKDMKNQYEKLERRILRDSGARKNIDKKRKK